MNIINNVFYYVYWCHKFNLISKIKSNNLVVVVVVVIDYYSTTTTTTKYIIKKIISLLTKISKSLFFFLVEINYWFKYFNFKNWSFLLLLNRIDFKINYFNYIHYVFKKERKKSSIQYLMNCFKEKETNKGKNCLCLNFKWTKHDIYEKKRVFPSKLSE